MRNRLFAVLAATLLTTAVACAEEDLDTTSQQSAVADQGRMGPGFGKHRRAKDPAARIAELKAELGLSDDQVAELQSAFANSTSREEHRAALEAILTPEQLAKHQEMMQRWRGMRGHHPGKMGPGRFRDPAAHIAMLEDQLGLSDDQVTQLQAAFAKATSREEHRAALESILTPEQLAKHQEMMKQRRGKRGMRGPRGMHGMRGMNGPAQPAQPDSN